MTDGVVIDCSIALSWVHPDQSTPASQTLLGKVEAGLAIYVPELWFTEVANCLLVLQRRKRLTAKDRSTALEFLEKLKPVVDDESARKAFDATSKLAEKHTLTVYDATYLELALRLKLPLATRDDALIAAAIKTGVKLL